VDALASCFVKSYAGTSTSLAVVSARAPPDCGNGASKQRARTGMGGIELWNWVPWLEAWGGAFDEVEELDARVKDP